MNEILNALPISKSTNLMNNSNINHNFTISQMKDSEIKENLAYAYQIIAHLGMDDHTYTHLSALSEDKESFYIYPFGLRFCEVRSNSLLRVSLKGEILEGQEYQYNKTGYILHGAIYNKRADIASIFHIHTPAIVAVSACKNGLLPISQWALHFYEKISYSEYDSLALHENHGNNIANDIQENYIVLMRNHGSITCGRTIQEAMFYLYHLQQACKTQCLALSMGQELILPSKIICETAVKDLLSFEKNLGDRDWKAWVRLISSLKK